MNEAKFGPKMEAHAVRAAPDQVAGRGSILRRLDGVLDLLQLPIALPIQQPASLHIPYSIAFQLKISIHLTSIIG